MSTNRMRSFAVAVVLLAGAAFAQAPVPERVNFNARLTDGSGVPVSGNHQVQLGLFDAASGGTSVWTETTTPTFSATGTVSIEMGATTPLTATILGGGKLYLQITVDGTPLTPRVGMVSVPYAIRAGVAAQAASATRLGTLQESDVQRRVTGACPSGQMMTAVAADGTVTCATPVAAAAGRQTGGSNLIDWTPTVANWTFEGGTAATIALNTGDVLEGASSFDLTVNTGATGSVYTYGAMIPIDPTRRYRGEVAAKLITGAGTFYAGYQAYDAAGAALTGNGGSYGYFIANGVTLNNNWQRYAGSIQGEGTALDQFPAGTRFIRPLIITNYQNIGQTRVDAFSIVEMPTVRSVPRAFGNGPQDTTCDVNGACGPTALSTRRLVMNKQYRDTDLRLSYTDTMRTYAADGTARTCRWHLFVDGVACPSGDVAGSVYAHNADLHQLRTLVGYCRGLAPGAHTVQVYVSNQAGYQARCYTGWPGDVTWTLEAEEVR